MRECILKKNIRNEMKNSENILTLIIIKNPSIKQKSKIQ